MTKLNEFIGNIKSGVAKSQYFTVQLTLPSALDRVFKDSARKVTLFCDQTQMPGLSFSTSQVRSYGEFKEVPYEKLYEPVTMSFYVDVDMTVRKLFDAWMELIQSPDTRDFNWPKQYMTDTINIYVEDMNDNRKYCVTLNKAYPKAVAPIQLDYASKDVMKLSVTFTYQYATTQLLASQQMPTDNITSLTQQMPNYNYGYSAVTEVPLNYFTDFSGFQNAYQLADFSTGGVKSLTTVENIGEITGFGGIFV